MKTPRFGWIVGATACGAVVGVVVSLLLFQAWRDQPAFLFFLFAGAFYGASVGTIVAVVVEAIVFRFHFAIDQFLELFIVCALLMFFWGMYVDTASGYAAYLERLRNWP